MLATHSSEDAQGIEGGHLVGPGPAPIDHFGIPGHAATGTVLTRPHRLPPVSTWAPRAVLGSKALKHVGSILQPGIGRVPEAHEEVQPREYVVVPIGWIVGNEPL